MRWPIFLAQMLGDVTANYRWFAALYLAVMFVIAPLLIFLLSLAGTTIMYCVLGPLVALASFVSVMNVIQNHRSHWLPHRLRDWDYLPLWMRSLQPLDDIFSGLSCCSRCINPPMESITDGDKEFRIDMSREKPEMSEMQILVTASSKKSDLV